MLEHRRRRAQFAALPQNGYRPWEGARGAVPAQGSHAQPHQPASPQEKKIMDLRAEIASAATSGQLADAANQYVQWLQLDDQQVMGMQLQHDLGNQLMAQKEYQSAATAYERLVQVYVRFSEREHVQLILALSCARYLNQPQRANELLDKLDGRLEQSELRELAQQLRTELNSA